MLECKSEQFIMLNALCNKILLKHDRYKELYSAMNEGRRKYFGKKIEALTCSIILLPLNPNRRYIESILNKFAEAI